MVRTYDSWDDLVLLAQKGALGSDGVDAAVVGAVTNVQRGRSFRWETEPERRIETEFGSKDAMISTYHLTVKVSSVIGAAPAASIQSGATVVVGIAVSPDISLDEVQKDYSNIKGAVFFLEESAVFDYESGLYAIVEDGTLMAVPNEGGDLHFPLLSANDDVQPPDGLQVEDLVKAR